MMDNDGVLKIIESGESQDVELKESFHSAQDFSKLMCGFANVYGGVIVVGVDNGRKIVGIKEESDTIQQRSRRACQSSRSQLPGQ